MSPRRSTTSSASPQPDDTTLVALDFEETEGNQMTLDQARQFLTLVADALGRKPVLYCGGLFKTEMGDTADAFFGSHRLWLAQYGANSVAQASWNTILALAIHRFARPASAPNQVDGIPGDTTGNLDCNSYASPRSSSSPSGRRDPWRNCLISNSLKARGRGLSGFRDRGVYGAVTKKTS